MTTKDEAIKQALASEAKEQPAPVQQEPEYAWPTVADYERDVGFQTNEAFRMAWNMARTTNRMLGHASSQSAQRQARSADTWVGLTNEDINVLLGQFPRYSNEWDEFDFHVFARAIEAKLREKNWQGGEPYYTAQQLPAQPLTDDKLADLWYKQSLDWMEFARAIEAAHGIKENT